MCRIVVFHSRFVARSGRSLAATADSSSAKAASFSSETTFRAAKTSAASSAISFSATAEAAASSAAEATTATEADIITAPAKAAVIAAATEATVIAASAEASLVIIAAAEDVSGLFPALDDISASSTAFGTSIAAFIVGTALIDTAAGAISAVTSTEDIFGLVDA